MVAGSLFAAIQTPGVVAALVSSGANLGALVEAADAHVAAELLCLCKPRRPD